MLFSVTRYLVLQFPVAVALLASRASEDFFVLNVGFDRNLTSRHDNLVIHTDFHEGHRSFISLLVSP
jgi:hypothetical protein